LARERAPVSTGYGQTRPFWPPVSSPPMWAWIEACFHSSDRNVEPLAEIYTLFRLRTQGRRWGGVRGELNEGTFWETARKEVRSGCHRSSLSLLVACHAQEGASSMPNRNPFLSLDCAQIPGSHHELLAARRHRPAQICQVPGSVSQVTDRGGASRTTCPANSTSARHSTSGALPPDASASKLSWKRSLSISVIPFFGYQSL
jgi:hypothetical protein